MIRNFCRIALRIAAVLLAAGMVMGAAWAVTPPYVPGAKDTLRSPQEWIERFAALSVGDGVLRTALQIAMLLGAAAVGHRALRKRP